MSWKRIGDIRPRYNASTLVAGDARVMTGWPGAEEAGYPDDEYDLDAGSVMIFDLDLMTPVVFHAKDCVRLLASFDGLGSKNVNDATLARALAEPGNDAVWGTFEVTSGAMVLTNSDCATPASDAPISELSKSGYEEGTTPHIPDKLPSKPVLIGKTMMVIPCANGRYEVTKVGKVDAPVGDFEQMLQLTIRRSDMKSTSKSAKTTSKSATPTPKAKAKPSKDSRSTKAMRMSPRAKKVTVAIPKATPKVAILKKAQDLGSLFQPLALGCSGKHMFVLGRKNLFYSANGKTFKLVGKASFQLCRQDMIVDGDEVWVCGFEGLRHSTNLGKSFKKVSSPKGALFAIAKGHDGAIWAAGHEGALVTSIDHKSFTVVKGLDNGTVRAAIPSPVGVLLLNDSGRLYIAADGAVRSTSLRAKSPLYDGCVTPSGTIVVVGPGNSKGSVFRSEDGGKQFKAGKLAVERSVYSIDALPDGRLIAGGEGDTILVSYDDGKSFQNLPHAIKSKQSFGVACAYDGGVCLGSMLQALVRVA